MAYEAFWIFISYFADIAYWIGFTLSFLVVYPLLDNKDKKKVTWVLYDLIPAVFFAYVVNYLLKITFRILRPCTGLSECPSDYSFPSGHTAVIFAFATIITLYEKKYKSYLWAIPLAILVGLSRVALGFHTILDVVGGAILGIVVSSIVYRLSDRIKSLLCKRIF